MNHIKKDKTNNKNGEENEGSQEQVIRHKRLKNLREDTLSWFKKFKSH